jgi:dihydropyrimidinase
MTREAKNKSPNNFFEVPFAMPSVETMSPVMYSEGVLKKRIILVRMVELLCEEPAERFGLFPKKGIIQTGSDADLVIFDPHEEWP